VKPETKISDIILEQTPGSAGKTSASSTICLSVAVSAMGSLFAPSVKFNVKQGGA